MLYLITFLPAVIALFCIRLTYPAKGFKVSEAGILSTNLNLADIFSDINN